MHLLLSCRLRFDKQHTSPSIRWDASLGWSYLLSPMKVPTLEKLKRITEASRRIPPRYRNKSEAAPANANRFTLPLSLEDELALRNAKDWMSLETVHDNIRGLLDSAEAAASLGLAPSRLPLRLYLGEAVACLADFGASVRVAEHVGYGFTVLCHPNSHEGLCSRKPCRVCSSLFASKVLWLRFRLLIPCQVYSKNTGEPRSGKGVIARVATELLGPENVTTLRTKSLDGRFEIGRFVGQLLVYAPDVNGRFLHEAGAHILKALTGEDPFSPEYKCSNATPPARPLSTSILITCNSRLTVHLEGDRGAWGRRLVVIDFQREGVSEEQQIGGLSDILFREEGPGILKWAVGGLEAFVLDDFKMHLNDRQRAIIADLLSESESCTCYAREFFVREEGARVTVKRAYTGYVRFCSTREWPPLSERKFEQGFKAAIQAVYGITQRHDFRENGCSARGWSGIMYNEPSGKLDDELDS